MSFTTNEPLKEIMGTLKNKLPDLKKMLQEGTRVDVLHGTVEMLSALIARYEKRRNTGKEKMTGRRGLYTKEPVE